MPLRSDPALIALHRFGFGAGAGELAQALARPQAFVRDQLARPAPLSRSDLPASDQALREQRKFALVREDERKRMASSEPTASDKPLPPTAEQMLYRDEAAVRFAAFAASPTPFIERLVLFWTNHFAISLNKGPALRASIGAFEREAIRPHVLGRFTDMLQAVEQHPAMLLFLDNENSTGPQSRTGAAGKRGLNENLAREILELHTLGVDGGYGQEDVTSLARILTGWTVTNREDDLFYGGRFTFSPVRHEPGAQTVLGKTYAQEDVAQGRAALADLATHHATARHLARKLARHFLADEPPQSLVARLEVAFKASNGDLMSVTRALVDAPECWSAPLTKIRSPQLFLAALLRAAPRKPEVGALLSHLILMGQPFWNPPDPSGWPDIERAWASPEGMSVRLDIAAFWGRLNSGVDPLALLDQTFGPSASAQTRQAIARAESRAQGLALAFMSPEFQRC